MRLDNLWKEVPNDTIVRTYENKGRTGLWHAVFRDTAFDDYFAKFDPYPTPFLMEKNVSFSPARINKEGTMLNWVITFFLLAVIAAVCGFGGLVGTLATVAKFLAIMFVALFVASLIYGMITGQKPAPPEL